MIEITPTVRVSPQEISFTSDRSPGPGGQNVNKSNTRVTLEFDVGGSISLTGQQKDLLQKALSSRINQEGVLRITSSKERTQLANRRQAVNRFIELVSDALKKPKPRKKTRVSPTQKAKRLAGKRKRSQVKSDRAPVEPEA